MQLEQKAQDQPDEGLSVYENWPRCPDFSLRSLVQSILMGPGKLGLMVLFLLGITTC